MDALDHLAGPAADLLTRVDDLLAGAGAPDGHPIWPLLRRLRALPGEAVAAVAALRPQPLAAAGSALRGLTPGYDDASATLTRDVAWEGAGAESFAAHRAAFAAHLTGGPESLTGRLAASGSYLDALADWMVRGRVALARTLAEVLGSAEAVRIVVGSRGPASTDATGAAAAAAEIGARVLTTVVEVHDRGEALRQQWASSLAEVAPRSSAVVGGRADDTTRLDRTTRIAL